VSDGVFLLTGPSAAGKTTVARSLAERFPRGAFVEGDVFRRSIVSGRHEMAPDASADALSQLRLRYRVAAAAADAYAADGFTVAVEDVVAGPLLTEVVGLIGTTPLRVVVLLPSRETVAARASARAAGGYERFSIDQLYDGFVGGTPRIGLWLDSSGQKPDETVDEILARADEALIRG
jgi:chloramphenicol 3-O-phosphotransferase